MKKTMFTFVLALLALLCLSACGKKDEINFTSTGPLSGDNSRYGLSAKKGMELAIAKVNAEGGVTVDGKQYQIKFEMLDDVADPEKAVTAFTTIASKTDVFLGSVTSGAADAVASETAELGIPMITPTGTADHLTVGANNKRDDRYNVFRACYNDSFQGIKMAEFAKELGFTEVALLVNNASSYSTGLEASFNGKAAELGIATKTFSYAADTTDFTAQASAVLGEGKYNCIFVPDYYQMTASIVSQFRKAGYQGTFLGVDGWDGVVAKDYGLENFKDCYFCNHYFSGDESEAVTNFVKEFQEKNNGETPDAFAVLGYDAVMIAVQAIEKANSLKGADIIEALESTTFNCITGQIKFDENGNPQKDVVILTFDLENEGNYTVKK